MPKQTINEEIYCIKKDYIFGPHPMYVYYGNQKVPINCGWATFFGRKCEE